jgi:hypothetical protein
MSRISSVYVTSDLVVFDGQTASLGTLLEGGLPGLLHRLSATTAFGQNTTTWAGEGTALIDGTACAAIGLPYSAPTSPAARRLADNALSAARADGWNVSGPAPWMTFWRPRPDGWRAADRATVHIGMVPWIPLPSEKQGKTSRTPEIFKYHDDLVFDGWQTTARLRDWSQRTQCAYRMTPGVSLLSGIRDRWSIKRPGERVPTWRMTDPPPPAMVTTTDRGFGAWESPQPSVGPLYHAYDANLAFLAAMGVTEVTKGNLTFCGAPKFDPAAPRPGYWLIVAPAWNHARIPNPAGHVRPGDEVWVTTPTMVLLRQLHDQGVIGMPRIIQGWLALGDDRTRVFRSLATKVSSAIADLSTNPDDEDAVAVLHALKRGYKQAWGLLNSPDSLTYRPDWHHSIQAMARVNMWRKLWTVARRDDRWPVAINVDEVWYGSDRSSPVDASPLDLRPGAGGYKPTKSAKNLEEVRACLTAA